ncbi:hypothetical protein NCAS_0D01380 [Naumovozyma castellii]|uniref:Uncharacterized protein n=1 Tax=Naumovozyma castellii TaxID=27288 RepID=G0VDT0_NAUCA|nr:hypothetical protein NCAS_0D01380 [Naumovozyma castellii CBS 4309]CCC69719.1 hypothetical protein NCAS_0D01380 [Naumovozyma castellii CBS 4309]
MSNLDTGATFFESLCEEEQHLQENHENLQAVLKTLNSLTNGTATDAEIEQNLALLSTQYKSLVSNSVDLRYSKYQTRESQLKSTERVARDAQLMKRRQPTANLREYVNVTESINRHSLEYVNLLERLSVDLAKQVEISDPSVSKFVLNDWNPPKGVQAILDKFADPSADAALLKMELVHYLDDIKMSRAKYSLENKYSLQDKVVNLNTELNRWRKELDDIEMMMFGDGATSIKKMLANVESLRSKIMVEDSESAVQAAQNLHADEQDIEMK